MDVRIQERQLTDGSIVHSVMLVDNQYKLSTEIHCIDYRAAHLLYEILGQTALDFDHHSWRIS